MEPSRTPPPTRPTQLTCSPCALPPAQVASLKERVSPAGLWALLQSTVAGLLGGAQGRQDAAAQQQQQQQQQTAASAAQAVPPPPTAAPRKPTRQQVPLAGAGAAGQAAAAAAAATAARLAPSSSSSPLQPATVADPAQLREQLTGADESRRAAEQAGRRDRDGGRERLAEPEEPLGLDIRSLAAENVTVHQLKSR